MISALSWVQKGAAQETPTRSQFTPEEFERIKKHIHISLEEAQEDLEIVQEEEKKPKDPSDLVDELAIYNLDTYDQDTQTPHSDRNNALFSIRGIHAL